MRKKLLYVNTVTLMLLKIFGFIVKKLLFIVG